MHEYARTIDFAEVQESRGVPCVERPDADRETLAFYHKAEERFGDLLNVFKVFGHQPEYGQVFTDTILAILKDGVLSWKTKELLILKTTFENRCQYCVVQHERVCEMLGISRQKVTDLTGIRYRTSPFFSEAERSLLDFCLAIIQDATAIPVGVWVRLREHWSEAQIVDAAFVISMYTAVSSFAEALEVQLEEKFREARPQLHVAN